MKQIQIAILILTIFVTMFVGYLFPTIAAAEMDGFWVGKIVSVQGRVQVRRAGAAEWVSVRLNETYGFGDMIRVQEQSRAAVVLRSGAILRLDQKTTITFSASEQKEESSLLDLLHGAAHFFSPTPRKLKVTTPFVNAAVGGTEFFVRVERNQTLLSVFEGRVAAINEAGSLVLASGQSAIAWTGQAPVSQVVVRPRDAVQWALYYPPILDYQPADFPGGGETSWQAMVRKSIGFFWGGDLASAFFNLKETPDDISDPRFFTYRAALHLSVGRVDDASADIEKALNLDPYDNHAFALQSIIVFPEPVCFIIKLTKAVRPPSPHAGKDDFITRCGVFSHNATGLQRDTITIKERTKLVIGRIRRTDSLQYEQIALRETGLNRSDVDRLQELRLKQFAHPCNLVTRQCSV